MKVVILQYDVYYGDVEKNLNKVKALFEEANLSEDDVVVLPEMWTSGYDLENLETHAAKNLEPIKSEIINLAKKYSVNIIAGSIPNKMEDGNVYNTAFYVNKSGEMLYDYSKIHLVPMLNEPEFLTGGKKSVETFNLLGEKAGLVICYDLRFPELFRDLALQEAKIIFVVAEWPLERKDHWLTLLKARAIENQCYIVGCNNIGTQNNDTTFAGNSVIYNPFGEVLVQGNDDTEEILKAEIDLDYIKQVRTDIPIFSSRRKDMYKFL